MAWRFLKILLLVMFVAAVTGAGYFWYTFMSPYGYHPAEPAVIDERIDRQDVFVYGTLRNDFLRWLIMGTPVETRPAKLAGYRRHDLDIEPEKDARVTGEVLTVTPEALEALDRYERLGVRYERKSVRLEDGSTVWVYRRIKK